MQDMTDTMTRVTLTNTTTTNTTTISSSTASSSSSHSVIDLTIAQSSSSISSTRPLHSTSTTAKERKAKPKKLHTYDDYLVYILKWPVSLIDELGLHLFLRCFCGNKSRYSIEPEPGILYKDFLGEDAYPVPVLELYSSFDEYEEITLPWLFEETFEEVRKTELESNLMHIRCFSRIDQTRR